MGDSFIYDPRAVLTATFNVPLATPFLLDRYLVAEPLVIDLERCGFKIRLQFWIDEVEEEGTLDTCSHLRLAVSRPEMEPPDMDLETDDAVSNRTAYLNERREAFVSAGYATIFALVQYLRVEMGVSQIKVPIPNDFQIANPMWTFDGRGFSHHLIRFRIVDVQIRSDVMDTDRLAELRQYLLDPPQITLQRSLLVDARRSLAEGNERRAVVELAMAAEIATKRAYFADSTPAGAAFDYMEGKRPSLPLKEWLSGAAVEAFGEAFSTAHGQEAKDVDYLMRCRNQVVHRGQLAFRDDGGTTVNPNEVTILRWMKAVNVLLEWLSKKSGAAKAV
jgi:hypothetical protein